ncbi:BON domain-containing protein [Croceibacterium sp. TMG7-5b_MA50]|uniref:BON domain-containing protein n=1 Tax=Croceibacterium sp. TMG7-5b_MA50 TaxID=3121290 RepID=UPI003221DD69
MNRNYDRRDREHRYDNRQNEQFSDRDYGSGDSDRQFSQFGQMGEGRGWNHDDDDDYGSSRGRYGRGGGSRSYGGGQGYGQSRGYDTAQDGRSRGGYGAAQPTNREGGFGSFNSNYYGGADFAGPRQNRAPGTDYDSYGPYGASQGVGSFGAAPSRGGYSARGDDDRGFFDKAGDEVASWFGDRDAARRRDQDHRGSGPANYTRSDQRILEDVCDTITHDRMVDGRQIQVTVQDGEVTLDGTVTSRQQKRRAEDLTDDLSGVKHVQNNLRVKDSDDSSSRSFTRDSTGSTLA